MSSVDDTTTSNNDLTDSITTDISTSIESFTTNVISNQSCYPTCYTQLKPTPDGRSFTTTFVYSFVVVLLISVIATSIVVFRRYHQQHKKERERSQVGTRWCFCANNQRSKWCPRSRLRKSMLIHLKTFLSLWMILNQSN